MSNKRNRTYKDVLIIGVVILTIYLGFNMFHRGVVIKEYHQKTLDQTSILISDIDARLRGLHEQGINDQDNKEFIHELIIIETNLGVLHDTMPKNLIHYYRYKNGSGKNTDMFALERILKAYRLFIRESINNKTIGSEINFVIEELINMKNDFKYIKGKVMEIRHNELTYKEFGKEVEDIYENISATRVLEVLESLGATPRYR